MTAPVNISVDLSALLARIDLLEERLMATAAEQIAAVSAQIDDIKADFTALLAALAAERENLTAAGQAAFDALAAKVDTLDATVGDADGSDAPVEPPAEPVV